MQTFELPETTSIDQLAKLFNVTDRQARNLLKDAKVKSHARGQWPVAEAVQAVLAKAREAREPDQLAAARARAINAKARQQELATARLEKELMPVFDLTAAFDRVMAANVQALTGLPARVTRDLELRNKIEAEIDRARHEMVAALEKAAVEIEADNLKTEDD